MRGNSLMEPCEPSHAGHAHGNKGSRSYATVVPIAVRTRCIRGTSRVLILSVRVYKQTQFSAYVVWSPGLSNSYNPGLRTKMLFKAFVSAGFALASTAQAQTAASSYVEPDVPTGKPIVGDYTGALRPQIHYSPPKDFMVSRLDDSQPREVSRT